jgi:predicted methyltransferase
MQTLAVIREPRYTGPLLTSDVGDALTAAARRGTAEIVGSLDLGLTRHDICVGPDSWEWNGARYPYPDKLKKRTIYYWTGEEFAPISRYSDSLFKLVPTPWGVPTFEIDGIKMLPTAQSSPFDDARRKVDLIRPAGKAILDTCGGLGYFAAWCLRGGAARVDSYEKSPDVLWLRTLNPWSPDTSDAASLRLRHGDVSREIETLPDRSYDAVLHDPPRFGIAGELYSQSFYDQLARVTKPRGTLFHYTGTANKVTSGRDIHTEVARRLRLAGFSTRAHGDGVVGERRVR